MYQLDAVLSLINNLDLRDISRKFGPTWAIVVVNKCLRVEGVERYKTRPSVSEVNALISKYGECVYFYTQPGMYDSVEKLREKVESCRDAFLVP